AGYAAESPRGQLTAGEVVSKLRGTKYERNNWRTPSTDTLNDDSGALLHGPASLSRHVRTAGGSPRSVVPGNDERRSGPVTSRFSDRESDYLSHLRVGVWRDRSGRTKPSGTGR